MASWVCRDWGQMWMRVNPMTKSSECVGNGESIQEVGSWHQHSLQPTPFLGPLFISFSSSRFRSTAFVARVNPYLEGRRSEGRTK